MCVDVCVWVGVDVCVWVCVWVYPCVFEKSLRARLASKACVFASIWLTGSHQPVYLSQQRK